MIKSETHSENNIVKYLHQFKSHLFQYNTLSEATWQSIADIATVTILPRNSLILENNKYEKHARFIIKGAVKITFHSDLDYYVYDFREQSNLLCDTVSFLERKPSQFSIETINDCTLIILQQEKIMKILENNEEVKHLLAKMLNGYMYKSHQKQNYIRSHSADKRYSEFCKNFPLCVKYAKLGDIASFLGITQQSLSRLRKNNSDF